MKTSTRNIIIAASIFAVLAFIAMFSFDAQTIVIDGEEISGVAGFGIGIVGLAIGLLAGVFAIAVTGIVLVGVVIFLALIAIVVLGALGLALSPLLLPLLFLMGLVWLFNRCKVA